MDLAAGRSYHRGVATTVAEPTTYRLDAERYARIVESGALEGQRVELIDGIIVEMSPQSPAHALIIQRLTRHLANAATAALRVQLPLATASDSVPEPDLALDSAPESATHHPTSAVLVVEVAHSSQTLDSGRKAQLYAAAGVPVYWVVDLTARAVELRTDPAPGGYRTLRTLGADDTLPSPCEGVAELDVGALLAGV